MAATVDRRASCGRDFPTVKDIAASLEEATQQCYDFISIPISHPRYRREFVKGLAKERSEPFARIDLALSSEEWCHAVVAKVSDYIDCDSPDYTVRKQSEETLMQELRFALHLTVPVVLISLHKPQNANLSRVINSFICQPRKASRLPGIWIQVPLVSPSVQANRYCATSTIVKSDTWKWWNTLRCLCDHDRRVRLVLEVTPDVPSNLELLRWLGEPVKCLSSATIDHLKKYAYTFEDCLQVPLQPLMDNLDSNTYEVFEKDPVKYSEYQRAIYLALIDRVPEDQKATNTQVVMVVGAGRGPLVSATLSAAKRADRKIKVYAVEKNPNAIVTLLGLKEELYRDAVTIVSSDMREWKAPELADILVSELLGSFGDNELSPECLDGAQRFLKEDGISIPSSYTSFLVPIHSPKLYGEVMAMQRDMSKPSSSYNFESPAVCHQQTKLQLSDIQPLFTYYHPNKDSTIDNSRYKCLKFMVRMDSLLHGFSGFFDTVLYKDVRLSIEPSTYSEGMVSWFPIFIPIKNPVTLKAGDELVVHFWRLHNHKDVWYEWAVTSPVPIPIHNPNGRAYNIGLH